ncbi:transcription factor Tfb4 [Ephemerocybe angulata]|uniref:General transcription and DNA repair factor IIH subunit TFB4 n=1 Tax=Ephemerocybe angulata TaxID=980116 RepID=A0A8H6I981_9AGAR|nr:transcription factor Tfb4 [Tulosesus angulatus]
MSSSSHLSVVLDLSPSQWHLSSLSDTTSSPPCSLSLPAFLSQLIVFLNAHMASQHENSLAVFGAFPGKRHVCDSLVMLYASSDAVEHATPITVDANSYPPFKLLDTSLVQAIAAELDALSTSHADPSPLAPALVGALTKALCYVNRVSFSPSSTTTTTAQPSRDGQSPQSDVTDPRILILSVSPDLSTSYIPIMNAIFSAQKLVRYDPLSLLTLIFQLHPQKVTIDACQIYGAETVFLQQAAHLTGGSYLHLERRDALLQYLLMTFLSPPSIRKVLAVPTQDRIDFRAACFCHKNIVDIGFVCSVCLSIFCKPVPVCSTCRTKFPYKTVQRLKALGAPMAANAESARPSPSATPQPGTPLPDVISRSRTTSGVLPPGHPARNGGGLPSMARSASAFNPSS